MMSSNTDTKESSDLIGQRKIRIDKLNKLRELGIDPYPAKITFTYKNADVVSKFEELENSEVTVTGRVNAWREHGHIIFAEIEDQTGTIQLYIKDDTLLAFDKELQRLGFAELKLIDIGDFIQATGVVTKTQRGEISVMPHAIHIASKTIRPIPRKFEDKEERFRRRYVDMTVDPEIRRRFERRAIFWQAHRDFFDSKGFFEVNIPILEHIPGGGDAVPFLTHMNAIDEDFYLRISHELPLKRLIGGGFEKVYDIGARFRNEGLSDEHLPEHVAMEFYWAYADWKDGMRFIQEMYTYVLDKVYDGQKVFKIREFEVDFSKEWQELDFNKIMQERYGIKDIYTIELDEVKRLLTEHNIEFDEKSVNVPRGVDSLWKQIRKTIAGPAFLINHPKFLSPLQKPSTENPLMVERFQPIIAGSELGNGWSEVNDPIDQYERFVEQQKMRDSGDVEAQWLDIDYVEMLEYGMPPTFGYGHSERVFWFLENVTAREGVPFPQLKFHISDTTKKIYPEIDFSDIKHTEEGNSANKTSNYENVAGLPSIEDAYKLLEEYVTEDYHKLHAKMVAAAMRSYAQKFGANEELWYLTGLLHDLDYTKFPEEHPSKSMDWFKEWGYPEELIHAVAAHAWDRTGVQPNSLLAKTLIATDEMSGFFYAYSLMRPTGMEGMETKSILKRFKDKAFAPKISREEISFGVELMKTTLEDHAKVLQETFVKMQEFGGSVDFSQDFPSTSGRGQGEGGGEEGSTEQDFNHRIAIVINKELPNWQIANAVAHISAYLGHKLDEKFGTGENFVTKDGKNHPRNSQYPIVILAAKPGQMTNFMENVRQSGNIYHGFIREMIDTTNDEEITKILSEKSDSEIEYLGIGVYGDNEELKKLTNKFSLWG